VNVVNAHHTNTLPSRKTITIRNNDLQGDTLLLIKDINSPTPNTLNLADNAQVNVQAGSVLGVPGFTANTSGPMR
jgi:hypothetical protein